MATKTELQKTIDEKQVIIDQQQSEISELKAGNETLQEAVDKNLQTIAELEAGKQVNTEATEEMFFKGTKPFNGEIFGYKVTNEKDGILTVDVPESRIESELSRAGNALYQNVEEA